MKTTNDEPSSAEDAITSPTVVRNVVVFRDLEKNRYPKMSVTSFEDEFNARQQCNKPKSKIFNIVKQNETFVNCALASDFVPPPPPPVGKLSEIIEQMKNVKLRPVSEDSRHEAKRNVVASRISYDCSANVKTCPSNDRGDLMKSIVAFGGAGGLRKVKISISRHKNPFLKSWFI